MKNYFLLIFLLINSCLVFSQEKENKITFIVTTTRLAKDSSVYITGDNSKLGFWNPSKVRLKKSNDTTWERIFNFQKGEEINFKFTKGSWNKEALTFNGKVPGNSYLKVNGDTVIYVSIRKWKNEIESETKPEFKGQITGNVKYFYNLTDKGIKPRDIIVWLPPSYNIKKNKRYPVLYMQDGQSLFDPKTSAFGIDWQLDETADSLIKAKAIKEIIIVGIYNTSDRNTEYLDTQLGHKYMNFVANKLKPFIDKNFRTLPDRENTAVGGSSAGALISFMLLWEHSDVFSQAACLSPAFHIDDIDYIPKVLNYQGSKKKVRFYIDVGTDGLDARLKPGTEEMIKALKGKGYITNKDLEFYIAKGAGHNEAAWAKRNWRYLEFMFGKK
jgi:predicted alpha/beta superfamily hydrolase